VSNAFNHRLLRISEVTRQRILAVAAQLNYTPNAMASGLRSRRTHTVGLVVTNVLNPFYTGMVRAVQDAARAAGYSVILGNTDDDPAQEREMIALFRSKQVEGILLVTTGGNERLIREVKLSGTPIVLVDRGDPKLKLDTVRVDNEKSAEEAVAHLIRTGHRRIGLISGPAAGVPTRAGRLRGYENALRNSGLEVDAAYEKLTTTAPANGYEAATELLRRDPPPTALFVTNTFLAVGALEAVQQAGLRVPLDISFLMFDDPDWARLVVPPITSVAQPVKEIGEKAFALLIERIRGRRRPVSEIVLPTRLEIRRSCAAPRD
jgi:DNA-binding LacI/PurR family transcriptional regulator